MPEGSGRAASLPPRVLESLSKNGWHLIALVLAAAFTALTLQVLMRYPHPPGADGGQWLSIVNEFRGQGVSRVGTLAYPPLYLLLLTGLVALAGDPAAGIFASIAVVMFALSACAYAGYLLVTRDPKGAILFQALVSATYILFDMLSWGGYPSLLSIAFFCLAVGFLHRASLPGARRRDHALLGIAGGLVFLTHPLSSLLFAIAAGSYFALAQILRRDRAWFKSALLFTMPAFALVYLPYLALRWSGSSGGGAGLPNYLIEQPVYSLGFAFFPLVPTEWRKTFPFRTEFTVVASLVFSIIALSPLPSLIHRKRLLPGLGWLLRPMGHARAARGYLLFACTCAPVLLLPVGLWWRNLYTDYSRILFYLWLPAAAGLACMASRLCMPGALGELLGSITAVLRRKRPSPSPASGNPDSKSPPRRRARALAAAAVPWGAVAVLLALHSAYGYDYLRGASDYYIDFKEPADMELARWVRENTPPDSLIALSPDWPNQFKWLEGLSGRRALGYTEPRFLFYEREIQLNADVYRMFTQRRSVVGAAIEVATAGNAEDARFQLRLSVIDRRGIYPALDLRDSGMQAILASGPGPFVSEFVERWIAWAGAGELPGLEDGAITSIATKDSPPIAVRWEAGPAGRGAEIRIRTASPKDPLAGVFVTASPHSWPCAIRAPGSAFEWGVRTEAGNCVMLRLTAEPAMDVEVTPYNAKLTIRPDAGGSATLRIEAPGALPGTWSPRGALDSRSLFEQRGITHAVVPARSEATAQMLAREYGFPVVFRNARHVVLRAAPALSALEDQVASFVGNESAAGDTVVFAPRSGWHASTEVLRRLLGRPTVPSADSSPLPAGAAGAEAAHLVSDRVVVENSALAAAFHGRTDGLDGGLTVSVVSDGVPVPALGIPDARTFLEWSGGGGIFLSETVWGEAGVDAQSGTAGIFSRYVKDTPAVDLRRGVSLDGGASIHYRSAPEGPGIAAYVMAVSPAAPVCGASAAGGELVWSVLIRGSCVDLRLTASTPLEIQYLGEVAILRLPVSAPGEVRLSVDLVAPGAPGGGKARAFEVRSLFASLNAALVVVPAGENETASRLEGSFGAVRGFENAAYWVYRII